MQVFISWSGSQSQHVAVALRSWLPKVLDSRIKPFVSSQDIDKGDRGLNKIAAELEDSSYGIVVVTPSNQDSPWINFEAGALGKSVSDSRVAPILVGLSDADVKGPLKQFQNSAASDRAAVLSLVRSLNKALPDPLGDATLEVLFTAHWAEMEAAISAAPDDGELPQQPREIPDLLDEVLTTVRSLQRDMSRVQRIVSSSIQADSENVSDRLIDLARTRLKLSSFSISRGDDLVTLHLPEDAPKLNAGTLRALRDLAMSYGIPITVERTDGSSLTYTTDGVQSRIQPATLAQDEDEDEDN